jgi:hypothetical protein
LTSGTSIRLQVYGGYLVSFEEARTWANRWFGYQGKAMRMGVDDRLSIMLNINTAIERVTQEKNIYVHGAARLITDRFPGHEPELAFLIATHSEKRDFVVRTGYVEDVKLEPMNPPFVENSNDRRMLELLQTSLSATTLLSYQTSVS